MLNKVSQFIASQEGCRLKAYQDSGGLYTIGYGSTGPGIHAGVEWTQSEADERFSADVAKFLTGVRNLVKVKVTDNQLIALTSFAYNLGLHNLQRSGLLRLLNQEKYSAAAEQFLLWCKIGSYTSPGLLARRQREQKLFNMP